MSVILHTNHGDITLELDAENAPAGSHRSRILEQGRPAERARRRLDGAHQ